MLAETIALRTRRPAALALAALFALLAVSAMRPAHAQVGTTVQVAQNPTLGAILTDPNGMTLYVFMRDTPGSGTSACSGGCAGTWPAFQPPAGDLTLPDGVSGTLDTITRDDGTLQVTYNGSPLYYFSRDMNPGDTNGQGVGGVWFAATPQQ
jgi:predicted lipoprotein with Yx(FWY)xxD motif